LKPTALSAKGKKLKNKNRINHRGRQENLYASFTEGKMGRGGRKRKLDK